MRALCVFKVMSEYNKILDKKYDQFLKTEEGIEKSKLVEEIRELEIALDDLSSIDNHTLGLIYYDIAENEDGIINAHEYFLKSLDLDTNYYIARLYSAHCYHDKAMYSEKIEQYNVALSEYLKVDVDKLREEFPLWRYVKLLEQIGHCYHKTGNESEADKYFQLVLGFYKEEGFDELANPAEIFECLNESDTIFKQIKTIEDAYFES